MDDTRIYLVHAEIGSDRIRSIPEVDDVQELTSTVALAATTLNRSRLYHEVKWAGPGNAPVVVVELRTRPKATGVAPGAVTWMRENLPDA